MDAAATSGFLDWAVAGIGGLVISSIAAQIAMARKARRTQHELVIKSEAEAGKVSELREFMKDSKSRLTVLEGGQEQLQADVSEHDKTVNDMQRTQDRVVTLWSELKTLVDRMDNMTREHSINLGIINDRHPQQFALAGIAPNVKAHSKGTTGKSTDIEHSVA